jgi:peroxiredoxin
MDNRYGLRAAFAAGIALLALAAVLGVRAFRLTHAAQPVARAAACPADAKKANLDLTLPDLDGHDVKLSDYAGKVLLIDFWATWCVPCQVEIPGFVELHDKYTERGAQVLGLVVMDDFAKAKPFAESHHMTYPILNAVDREDVEAAFGPLMGLPTSFVVARDGRICSAHLGVPDVTSPEPTLEKSIERVFESEIVPLL